MKIIKILFVIDLLLLFSGFGWIIFSPRLSSRLIAFNQPVSPVFFGIIILLISIYQGLRLRKTYLRVRDSLN